MHVETWKENITEGGEVTLEMTKDPFPPELRNKFAKLARDFAVRVPLTDLMGKIQSHESARKHRIVGHLLNHHQDGWCSRV